MGARCLTLARNALSCLTPPREPVRERGDDDMLQRSFGKRWRGSEIEPYA